MSKVEEGDEGGKASEGAGGGVFGRVELDICAADAALARAKERHAAIRKERKKLEEAKAALAAEESAVFLEAFHALSRDVVESVLRQYEYVCGTVGKAIGGDWAQRWAAKVRTCVTGGPVQESELYASIRGVPSLNVFVYEWKGEVVVYARDVFNKHDKSPWKTVKDHPQAQDWPRAILGAQTSHDASYYEFGEWLYDLWELQEEHSIDNCDGCFSAIPGIQFQYWQPTPLPDNDDSSFVPDDDDTSDDDDDEGADAGDLSAELASLRQEAAEAAARDAGDGMP